LVSIGLTGPQEEDAHTRKPTYKPAPLLREFATQELNVDLDDVSKQGHAVRCVG
jgi:hypothetical protein